MLTFVPYIVAVLAAFLALRLPQGKDLAVVVFLFPYVALAIEIGVSLAAHEFVTAILVLKYIFFGTMNLKYFRGAVALLFFLGLCYLVAFATLNFGPDVPLFADGQAMRNGWGRVFTVSINLSTSLMFLVLIFSASKTLNVATLLGSYLWACLILSGFGLLQFFTFLTLGIDIFPIGVFAEGVERAGMVVIDNAEFLRVSSFGGEPKGLGQSLVVGFAIITLFYRELRWKRVSTLVAQFILLAVIFATISTSAFIMLFFVVMSILILLVKQKPFEKSEIRFVFVGISASMATLYYSIALFFDNLKPRTYETSYNFLDTLRGRTIGRLQFDDTDAIIWESFVGDYLGLMIGRGLGLIHHYAYAFIPPHQQYYMGGAIIPAKSGISYYVGHAGLLGLLFITLFAVSMVPTYPANRSTTTSRKMSMIMKFQILCIGLWGAHLLRIYTFDITWAIFGLGCVLGSQIQEQNKSYSV